MKTMGNRFITNTEILEAMDVASRQGRAVSSLDSVARILGVDNDAGFRRQAVNLMRRTQDVGACRFLEGKRRRSF